MSDPKEVLEHLKYVESKNQTSKQTLKTWEMIKKLTENPNKIFKLVNNGEVLDFADTDDNNYLILNIETLQNGTWEEVREPVSWKEAIEAWFNGKTIRIINEKENYDGLFTSESGVLGIIKADKNSEWYIED